MWAWFMLAFFSHSLMTRPIHDEVFLFMWYLRWALLLLMVPMTAHAFYSAFKERRNSMSR